MNKPSNLREHLLAAVPDLARNPDRLMVFIDKGKVRCTAAPTLSFEYEYSLQLILTDFAGHPDTVMVPILGWVRVNQSELLANLDKSAKGLEFEVDILDNSKVDMSIVLPLTERVLVKRNDEGTYDVSHPAEQGYQMYEPQGPIEIYVNGELEASYQPPPAPDGMALATPNPRRPADG
ncbi:phage tail protein [Pseudomonas japonica]|uniref:phage tail protein n=1 Tax=Pseudomonas japonica TaxID=256466 RepID=UPI003A88E280